MMDVKRKTKDNMITRIDIYLLCHCKNIELVYDRSRVAKPKVSFALNKNAQLLVYQCLKSLCFPNGYASNISRLVNMKDDKLFGMKSYDYQVFIQTFIPLAYQDLLSKGIWYALLKINHFFRDICSKKLHTQHIEKLETNIIQKIWNLEMIFPSSFFDLMEHLPTNLLFEVKISGLVRHTWMHPFERLGITQLS